MLQACVLVLANWLAFGCAFFGVGLLIRRALRLHDDASLTRTFWLGWCGVLFALPAWHLVLPISGWSALAVAGVSLAGFVWAREARAAAIQRLRSRGVSLALLGCVAVWMATLALAASRNGDSGLYHQPAVEWALRFPAVPGLGNLHGRLAFNNSSTLYVALLDSGPWKGLSHHLAAGLLVIPLFARGLQALGRLTRKGHATTRDVFDAVLLAGAMDLVLGPNFTSPSPDLPAYVLGAVLGSEFLEALQRLSRNAAFRGASYSVVFVAVAGVCVKLSFAGFAVGAALVIGLLSARAETRSLLRPMLVPSLVIAATAFVLWTLRGIVLSGYPGYPSTFGALPLDWRVPLPLAIEEANFVRMWGRLPGGSREVALNGMGWVGPWLRSIVLSNREVVVPVGLGLLALAIAAMSRLRHRRAPFGALALILIPTLAEGLWWFASAPDPRFAGALFWTFAAQGLVLAAAAGGAVLERQWSWLVAAIAIVLAVFPIMQFPRGASPVRSGFQKPAPVSVESHRLESGLVVYQPTAGFSCWGAPLLCTPALNPGLQWRLANEPRHGFRIASEPETGDTASAGRQ